MIPFQGNYSKSTMLSVGLAALNATAKRIVLPYSPLVIGMTTEIVNVQCHYLKNLFPK